MLSRVSLSLRAARLASRSRAFAGVRGYADEVKPPLALYGLNGTYATALYSAATHENSLSKAGEAATKLQELLGSDSKTREILLDPSLSHADKEQVITVVNDYVKGDKVFKGFLETLAANNRLEIVEEITADFLRLISAGEGIVEATITSAKPLDSATTKKLTTAISGSSFVGKDRKLKVNNVVDPNIKGGLVVSVGDRTVDLSVASKLQKYNQLLSEAA